MSDETRIVSANAPTRENVAGFKVEMPQEMYNELAKMAYEKRYSMKELILESVNEKWFDGKWTKVRYRRGTQWKLLEDK